MTAKQRAKKLAKARAIRSRCDAVGYTPAMWVRHILRPKKRPT